MQTSTIYTPDNLVNTGDVWLRFSDDYDEELAEYEANTYRNEDGFYAAWYHQDVGLVTYVGPFDSYESSESWFIEQGYEDYSS